MEDTIYARVANKVGHENDWIADDPVLLNGEIAISLVGSDPNNYSYRIKVGDGINNWSDIQYYNDIFTALNLIIAVIPIPNTAYNPGANVQGRIFEYSNATGGTQTLTNFLDVSNNPITVAANQYVRIIDYNGDYYKLIVPFGGSSNGYGAYLGRAKYNTAANITLGKVFYMCTGSEGAFTFTDPLFVDISSNPISVNSNELLCTVRYNGSYWIKDDILFSDIIPVRKIYRVAPSGGDYTTPALCLNDIHNGVVPPATKLLPIEIHIAPGTYANQFTTILGTPFNGLIIPSYVSLIGSNTNGTLIRGKEALTAGDEVNWSTLIRFDGVCRFENITFEAYRQRAAVTNEYMNPLTDLDIEFKNCIFKNYGGQSSGTTANKYDVDLEFRFRHKFTFTNCRFLGVGINLRNANSIAHRDTVFGSGFGGLISGFTATFDTCEMGDMTYTDYFQYNNDRLNFYGCNIQNINVSADDTLYLANVGNNNAANIGLKPALTDMIFKGGHIGIVNNPNNTWIFANTVVGGRGMPLFIGDHMEYATNTSGVNVTAGTVVEEVFPYQVIPNAYTGDNAVTRGFMKHTGSIHRVMGVLEDIAPASGNIGLKCVIRYRGRCLVLFDLNNGAVVAGDPLQASAAIPGFMTKWNASKPICGYALEANAGGGVLKVELALANK